MNNLGLRFAIACSLAALAGCNQQNTAHRDETPGEQVGRAAYEAKKEAKKAAQELSKDLKSFSHDAKAGYQEEKQKNGEREKTREDRTPPPQ